MDKCLDCSGLKSPTCLYQLIQAQVHVPVHVLVFPGFLWAIELCCGQPGNVVDSLGMCCTATAKFLLQLMHNSHTHPGRGTLPSQQAAQLFKMAKQCLDRAEGIYSTAHAEGRVLCRRQQTTAQPVPAAPGHPLPPQKQRCVYNPPFPLPTNQFSISPMSELEALPPHGHRAGLLEPTCQRDRYHQADKSPSPSPQGRIFGFTFIIVCSYEAT